MAEKEDQGLLPPVPSLLGHSLQRVTFSNLVRSSWQVAPLLQINANNSFPPLVLLGPGVVD